MRPIISTSWMLIVLVVVAASAMAADPQSYDDLDHPMYTDPELAIPPPIHLFDKRLAQLWTDALEAPDADARRRSAETMVAAKRRGMQGLEIAIPNLVRLADDENERPMVRFAAMRALVAIDAREEADTILRTAISLGSDAEADAISALARWKYAPARGIWRQRLESDTTAHRDLLLAIQGVTALDDTAENGQLKELVVNRFAFYDIRLAAARALAQLEPAGLEELSAELMTDKESRRHRILAAAVLRHHSGDAAEDLLESLTLDGEPAVANLALERLIEIAPERIVEHEAVLIASRDTNVRRWTVKALAMFPSAAHAQVLAQVTNDPNPSLRVLARDTLLSFATDYDLRDAVLVEADQLLAGEDWRGIEQGCRLVGYLDHKPAAQQLLKVLPNRRIEAHTTAAWALRKLAVPETLPDALAFAKTASTLAIGEFRTGLSRHYDPQLTQLFEFFGEMKYAPADPLLRKFVPKLSMSVPSRCAAIWALGHIHEGKPPEELVSALEARIKDVGVSLPEMEMVRAQCAIALGRMNARSSLPLLQRMYDQEGSYTLPGYAFGWAVERMTGVPFERPVAPYDYEQGFFLAPID